MADELTIELQDLETGEVFEIDFDKMIDLIGDLYERPYVVLQTLYKNRLVIINLKRKAKEHYADVKAEFDEYVGEKTRLYSQRNADNPLHADNAKITNNTIEKAVESSGRYKDLYSKKKRVKAYGSFLNDLNFLMAEMLSFAKAIMLNEQIDQMDVEEESEVKQEEIREAVDSIIDSKPEMASGS